MFSIERRVEGGAGAQGDRRTGGKTGGLVFLIISKIKKECIYIKLLRAASKMKTCKWKYRQAPGRKKSLLTHLLQNLPENSIMDSICIAKDNAQIFSFPEEILGWEYQQLSTFCDQ